MDEAQKPNTPNEDPLVEQMSNNFDEKTPKVGSNQMPKFPMKKVPESDIQMMKFEVDVPNYALPTHPVVLTKKRILVNVVSCFKPPLEFGDHIVAVNGNTRFKIRRVIEEARTSERKSVEFTVNRVKDPALVNTGALQKMGIQSAASCGRQFQLVPDGQFKVFSCLLVCMPRTRFGMSVKSVGNRVYVESIDNGFSCLGRRYFLRGDCILAVDGKPVDSANSTAQIIGQLLRKNKMVRIIFERAQGQLAINAVMMDLQLLNANQVNWHETKLQRDVVDICRRQLEKLKNDQEKPLKSIYAPDNKSSEHTKHVKVTDNRSTADLLTDMHNPHFLRTANQG